MRLYQNDNGEVELYQLPNTAQPAFPTFLCALQDNDLVIFVGRWIRFPTVSCLRQFGDPLSHTLVPANFTA